MLAQWLDRHCKQAYQIKALPGDASFRVYHRVLMDGHSYIAMDASAEKKSCLPFVAIARALNNLGLSTPEIIASDLDQGFLLLTDFGDRLYLHELTSDNVETLYSRALDALRILQSCQAVEGWQVPIFTASFMQEELYAFQEWFLIKHLNLSLSSSTLKMLDSFYHLLATEAASQPQALMHRDYHSANLMLLPEDEVGILDFQDAFIGPVTYDAVSLLRDCYIDWPDNLIYSLAKQFKQEKGLAVSDDAFIRWFDLMGLQRHLKALLTFSRKYHRDANPSYLKHIPRTLKYIDKVSSRHPECQEFYKFVQEVVGCVP